MVWLSGRPESIGRTYHLADPAPYTVDRILTLMGYATGKRRVLRVPVPYQVARRMLDQSRWLRRQLGVTPQLLDYFMHPTQYDTANASRDLAPGRIAAPRFDDYLHKLVEFMKGHPEIGVSGMQ